MSSTKTTFIEITGVEYQSEYKLKLTFNDGKIQVVDFGPFLKRSQHPEIRKYLSLEKFVQFTFQHGYFYWNDYDLSFPVDDLYKGQIT